MDRQIVLKGTIPFGFVGDDKFNPPNPGPIQIHFTQREEKAARAIAKEWKQKGLLPILFSKDYGGNFKRMRVAA